MMLFCSCEISYKAVSIYLYDTEHHNIYCMLVDLFTSLPSRIEHGLWDVDLRDTSGLRPLHLAAEQGHVDACLALLRCGAAPDGTDLAAGTETPLLLAAESGHAEVCALLVTFRADPLASSLDGRTPLAVVPRLSCHRVLLGS